MTHAPTPPRMSAAREAEIVKLLNNAYLDHGNKSIWDVLRALGDTLSELHHVRAERDGLEKERKADNRRFALLERVGAYLDDIYDDAVQISRHDGLTFVGGPTVDTLGSSSHYGEGKTLREAIDGLTCVHGGLASEACELCAAVRPLRERMKERTSRS